MILKGNEILEVTESKVKITKRFLGVTGDITIIPIEKITSVVVKAPGMLGGFIRFSTKRGASIEDSRSTWVQSGAAAKDPNSVQFAGKKNLDIALEIKEMIDLKIEKFNSTEKSQYSVADELLKFKSLLNDGSINEEEFESQKKKLLE